jgi:hypothetical protein
VELLNEFDTADVIIVDRLEGKSSLRRLNRQELEGWLEDYSLGELWKKNVLGALSVRFFPFREPTPCTTIYDLEARRKSKITPMRSRMNNIE